MKRRQLETALRMLGAILERRETEYELVIIGSTSLIVQRIVNRTTQDVDVLALVENNLYRLADPLPDDLIRARNDVAVELGLDEEWLNAKPSSMLDMGLPAGFEKRVITRRYGALTIHFAGRLDMICFKFHAAADREPSSRHFQDLKKLQPGPEDLRFAAAWARSHDPSEAFRAISRQVLAALGVEETDA